MKNKYIVGIFGLSIIALLSGCATSNSEPGALVEDATDVEPITNVEDGAVIVGDNYVSENDGLTLSEDAKVKWEALKQDAVIGFAYDSDAISPEYMTLLQTHAEFLRDNISVKIIIEGHTDERGTLEYNVALGERRARSVARYLLNLGVTPEQISIVSYGEEKPAVVGHTESAWMKNRRAVIVY